MKMIFIHKFIQMQINQTRFHVNGFAFGLVLKQRQKATIWPIESRHRLDPPSWISLFPREVT